VSGQDQTLLVAQGRLGEALAERFGDRCARCADPYDALLEMSRRRWPAIVMAAPQEDFEGLCRASRRLQSDARLFAVCPASAEPDVRELTGDILDDYFIYPPTRGDVRRMLGVTGAPGASAGGLGPGDFAEMAEAARTIAALEACVARTVARRCGAPVEWIDAENASPQRKPLLLVADDDAPRVLVTKAPMERLDRATEDFLAGLRQCLPALMEGARRTESLHHLAITDHLTGAYNRRYFYHVTDQILARDRRRDSRETLLLFDIDDFKRYNDTYGHAAGDEILREIVRLIQRTTRNQDVVARIGGDEFAVLFWDIAEPRQPDSRPPEAATVMAERFRRVVKRHEFPSLGPEARGVLSISGGLASYPDGGRTCRELLSSADRALRDAKTSGKDSIRLIGQ